jgi:hypothetical protein
VRELAGSTDSSPIGAAQPQEDKNNPTHLVPFGTPIDKQSGPPATLSHAVSQQGVDVGIQYFVILLLDHDTLA